MEPIMQAVCREFGITQDALLKSKKLPTPVRARMVCYWLSRKLAVRLADTEIYRALGRKRAMIQRSVDAIDAQRNDDTWLRETTDRLLAELSA